MKSKLDHLWWRKLQWFSDLQGNNILLKIWIPGPQFPAILIFSRSEIGPRTLQFNQELRWYIDKEAHANATIRNISTSY